MMSLEELQAPPAHAARAPRLDPVPHVVLHRTWGFCLAQRQLDALEDGDYEVVIDSTLEPGSLTYGECFLPGEREDEVLLTTHVCHPSLANDNLSGIALLGGARRRAPSRPRRSPTGFCSSPGPSARSRGWPETRRRSRRIVGGLALACVGDRSSAHLQTEPSRDALDRPCSLLCPLGRTARDIVDFVPWGWDERQFNSPGFDLPVGCSSRSREGEFEEYHSSADDLELVRPGAARERRSTARSRSSKCSRPIAAT